MAYELNTVIIITIIIKSAIKRLKFVGGQIGDVVIKTAENNPDSLVLKQLMK